MKKIALKLRSRSGASMIIALVFMMFCLFVGGSVLAAASSNGYRVEHLSDQQEYLSQRSAAMLISDELTSTGSLRLIVHDVTQTVQKVTVGNGGVVTPTEDAPETFRTITFEAPNNLKMTAMQRVMYEATVAQYLKTNSIDSSVNVVLDGFVYQLPDGTEQTITSTAEFWYPYDATAEAITGTVQISVAGLEEFTANFHSCEGDDLYSFAVDFGGYSQLSVVMYAAKGERSPVERVQLTTWDSHDAEVTTVSRQPVISWDTPMIKKGGV